MATEGHQLPSEHIINIVSRRRTPSKFKYTKDAGQVDGSEPVAFSIALKNRNTGWLEQRLKEASDPKSPSYGQYSSAEEINARTAPSQETFDRVCKFLDSKGFGGKYEKKADYIEVRCAARDAENLFGTRLHRFIAPDDEQNKNNTDKFAIRRTGSFTIPSEIHDVVDLVTGI
eukprot:GEZU01001278.1.p1 GENE.GEZU01001278.1~~GEZU01001278.1.p1  ORF type:complete len:173 (+),score=36.48 GEZU01001278.1:158-676(+)